jgi:hypothetical protein
MRVAAVAGGYSNAVDLYNSASGTWSTAQLSVGRGHLVATSVANVAIFAGGSAGILRVALCQGVRLLVLICVIYVCWKCVDCCCLCLRCSRLPSHASRCSWWIFQCCGLVQQCIGHMVNCAAQCGARPSCCDICWERCFVCWGLHRYFACCVVSRSAVVGVDMRYLRWFEACCFRLFVFAVQEVTI